MHSPTILKHKEKLILFSDGRKKLPGAPTYRKLDRWAREGLKSLVNGDRVTLEWVQYGSCRATSAEAFQRFQEKINREAT